MQELVRPDPAYPARQWQEKAPIVLLQTASDRSQVWVPLAHSLMSLEEITSCH